MTITYKIKHRVGGDEPLHYSSYRDAVRAVRARYGTDAVIGHDGDIDEGGQFSFAWRNSHDAEGGKGANACAKIVAVDDGQRKYGLRIKTGPHQPWIYPQGWEWDSRAEAIEGWKRADKLWHVAEIVTLPGTVRR